MNTYRCNIYILLYFYKHAWNKEVLSSRTCTGPGQINYNVRCHWQVIAILNCERTLIYRLFKERGERM